MDTPSVVPAQDENSEISFLLIRMRDTMRRLQELTAGNLDIEGHPDGLSPQLREARETIWLSEVGFRGMFDAAATGIAISSPQGRFLKANAAYCEMLGYTEQELRERDVASVTHQDDLSLNLELREELLSGQRKSFVMEKRYVKKNGELLWTRHSVAAARWADGQIATLIAVAEDITKRKLAEVRLSRLNRLHVVLSKVGATLVRARDRQGLFDTLCHILVGDGLLRMVSIAEIDAVARLTRPVASAGEGQEYLREPEMIVNIDGGPLSLGTVGTATRSGSHDICNDIAASPRMKPWHEAALRNGLRANAAFPLKIRGQTIAVLVLYSGETNYFMEDEIDLMITVADNISFALEVMETEQQRQHAIEVSNHLAAIVQSSHDAIISEDLSGIVNSWNRGAERTFGYSRLEMEGDTMMKLVLPGQAMKLVSRVINGESVENLETLLRAKDGRLINVAVTASPIRNARGDIVGVAKVARDITQAKRIEARFRRLVDSNAQGVMFWKNKGEVTDCNDAFLKLVFYTRDDLNAGRVNWVAMTPPEYADLDRKAMQECDTTGVCASYEKEFIRKDGSRVPILLGAATFTDEPDEGVCFVLDLTERKLLERQFWQAQKMESIGTLAGGVAHDFNNLLAVIRIESHLLNKKGGLSTEQADSVARIGTATDHATALTRQLLRFSSREVLQSRELDLNQCIKDTIKLLDRLVGEHIQVHFKMASQPMLLNADPGLMHQVLMNLVVNACDAMPHGGQISIETFGTELDDVLASRVEPARVGSFVCMRISDTGCGIPPDVLPIIFEPFMTTKGFGKGTGLGLATVFGIVRQHQGWVTVHSEVGHGATFHIYLPRLAASAGNTPYQDVLGAVEGGYETILLVEDDAALRASIRTALSLLGYHVLDAPSGLKALEVWKESHRIIHLLLTDLMMPDGMTGDALAQTVRQQHASLKVIYMSGYGAEVIGTVGPTDDGIEFLAKPFRVDDLAAAIRRCLDSRSPIATH